MGYLEKLVSFRFSLIKLALSSKSLSKQSYEELRNNLKITNELINRFRNENKINEVSLTNIEDYIISAKAR